MRSAPLREAYEVAEAYLKQHAEKHRGAMDRRFNLNVLVQHNEGSTLFFRNAFLVRWEGWYIIIPEHHDVHIYHEEDVNSVFQFRDEEEVETITDPASLGVDTSAFRFDHKRLKWTP